MVVATYLIVDVATDLIVNVQTDPITVGIVNTTDLIVVRNLWT